VIRQAVCACLLSLVARAAFACGPYSGDLEIPIEIEFRNPEYRHDWIFRSLQPRLTVGGSYEGIPHLQRVEDGKFLLVFCVRGEHLKRHTKLVLRLAADTMKLAPRPITWRGEGRDRVGTMAKISLLDRPDTDWVAIRAVRAIPDVAGQATLLEVSLTNFGPFESGHDRLVIDGRISIPIGCMGPDNSEAIHLQETSLSVLHTMSVSDRGEHWTMLGDQKVSVPITLEGDCYYRSFSAEVPIQVRIPAGRTTRVALRVLSETTNGWTDRGHASRWWDRWGEISVGLEATNAFPSRLSLRESSDGRALLLR
jgi:hypothetical protein